MRQRLHIWPAVVAALEPCSKATKSRGEGCSLKGVCVCVGGWVFVYPLICTPLPQLYLVVEHIPMLAPSDQLGTLIWLDGLD